MKKVPLIALIAVVLTGCNDTVEKLANFSKPQLRNSESSTEVLQEQDRSLDKNIRVSSVSEETATEANNIKFPTERTLTDVNGRTIEARILAKSGNEIAIARLPSNQRFILPLDKLAQADQVSLSSIRDGGEFEAVKHSMNTVAMPANRTATWHTQIANAEKEAANFGIPLLVAVLINGTSSSTDLEKNLAYSRDFKSWADRNVALCMIRTDGFSGVQSRDDSFDTWVSLQRYGIKQSANSSLLLIDPVKFTSTEILVRGAMASSHAISKLEFAMSDKSKWSNIVAAPVPIRIASQFKVGSRAACGTT